MNRPEKSIFSPREIRERELRARLAAEGASARRINDAVELLHHHETWPERAARAHAALAEEVKRINANHRLHKIAQFRALLEPHRLGWFDSLSDEDQFRLARDCYELRPVDTRSDIQKDYDEEREHGWSV